jgi:hypothetical protein
MHSSTPQKDLISTAQHQPAHMTDRLSIMQRTVLTALACVFVACQQEAPSLTPPSICCLTDVSLISLLMIMTSNRYDGHHQQRWQQAMMAAVTHSSCHSK